MGAVTSSVGTLLSRAAMDPAFHRQRHHRRTRRAPTGFADGIGEGASRLAHSMSSAVTGLVRRPRGERGGMGVLRAASGLVFKPVTGVVDVLDSALQGLRNRTAPGASSHRRGRRALYGSARLLRDFDPEDARVAELLLLTVSAASPDAAAGGTGVRGLVAFCWLNNALLVSTDRELVCFRHDARVLLLVAWEGALAAFNALPFSALARCRLSVLCRCATALQCLRVAARCRCAQT